jgi:peptidoglycan/xylan/chitin deacetylase (PgdA/CDA1 family)
MRKDAARTDGQPEPEQPGMSRRLMLIGSGGLMLGLATVVGCAPSKLAVGTLDTGPSRTTRRAGAGARSSARGGKPARVISTEAPPRPARHPKAEHPKPEHSAPATDGAAPAQPVYYVDAGPKVIALTIDDGPSPIYTPQVLRILEKYKVTASFSMIGENVTYYPEIAREVADAGHMIVNHTWNHADLALLSASQTRSEIASATDAIHTAVGKTPTMFRAPYGAWSRAALEYCASENLTPLDWSVDPRDWSMPGVREIVSNIMANTRTGSIILEHDGGGNRSETVAALKIVIPRLLDEGYHFTTA